jgi:dipeptidase D
MTEEFFRSENVMSSSALTGLEPQEVWKHFAVLAATPRPSTKEAAARNYVLELAKKLGLKWTQDAAGNVVVSKPARPGRENSTPALLQGHLDMVCEKNEGTAHNFESDAIEVWRDGDWLKAKGTTLGADNGVGVAAALAVMESTDIAHGPLEFVFTMDEETGLTGAAEFPGGVLKSKYFLNLDNEETGTLCIGCSGGMKTTGRRKVESVNAPDKTAYRIKIAGLKGGHSGVDIHQGRGNALRVLGTTLQRLMAALPIAVASIQGGSAQNAIPREASAVIVGDGIRESEMRELLAKSEAEWKSDLGSFDTGLQITVEKADASGRALRAEDAVRIVDALVALPHGVVAMSPDVPGLVQNSTNLAVVSVKDSTAEIITSQRSAIASSREQLAKMVATVFSLAGFEAEHSGAYPGWKPEPNSDIVRKLQSVHERLFGKPGKLIAMHAGLECGVIGEKYPGMQMISFGPTIVDPHSPNERVQISTVQDFWKFLKAALEAL